MALSVIGVGWGRTGKFSLKLALERLGFGPCYHTIDLYKRAELIPALARVADGNDIDWDALFEGYRSAVDWPACAYHADLMRLYPEARIILTERDPTSWYRSAISTILSPAARAAPDGDVLTTLLRMAVQPMIDRELGGCVGDRSRALASFKRHSEMVRCTVPAERLLVYRCNEGWEPLCRFLGVDGARRTVPAREHR